MGFWLLLMEIDRFAYAEGWLTLWWLRLCGSFDGCSKVVCSVFVGRVVWLELIGGLVEWLDERSNSSGGSVVVGGVVWQELVGGSGYVLEQ